MVSVGRRHDLKENNNNSFLQQLWDGFGKETVFFISFVIVTDFSSHEKLKLLPHCYFLHLFSGMLSKKWNSLQSDRDGNEAFN